jgi:hypothetical protein
LSLRRPLGRRFRHILRRHFPFLTWPSSRCRLALYRNVFGNRRFLSVASIGSRARGAAAKSLLETQSSLPPFRQSKERSSFSFPDSTTSPSFLSSSWSKATQSLSPPPTPTPSSWLPSSCWERAEEGSRRAVAGMMDDDTGKTLEGVIRYYELLGGRDPAGFSSLAASRSGSPPVSGQAFILHARFCCDGMQHILWRRMRLVRIARRPERTFQPLISSGRQYLRGFPVRFFVRRQPIR